MTTPERASFRDLVARMPDLPSIPATLSHINRVLDDPDSSAKDVSNALGTDQSLAAHVLKIVNSAFYGFPRRVDTLEQAVALLGYRPLRELILVTSLFNEVANKNGDAILDRKRFWQHAVGSGVAARVLARFSGALVQETVFLAGLLHDIGKVFLDAYLHEEYCEVVKLAEQDGLLILEAEERLLGANHTDFGFWLAEEWNLPQNLTAAVIHHHAPAQTPDHYLLACMVHMGDILARAMEYGYGGDELIPVIDRQAWVSLKLTPQLLEQAIEDLVEEAEEDGIWFLSA